MIDEKERQRRGRRLRIEPPDGQFGSLLGTVSDAAWWLSDPGIQSAERRRIIEAMIRAEEVPRQAMKNL